jgi:hypothetical protein
MRRAAILLLIVVLGACIPTKNKKSSKTPLKAAPVTAVAQKRSYDAGVGHFAEERYAEAKKSWQETVRLGASTQLGLKAKDNIQKVDAILSSLKELEKKQ